MKKLIITASLFLLTTSAILAQNTQLTNLFGIGWNINFPNNSPYLSKTSYAGGKIEYRHFSHSGNLSFGLALDWANYEQHIPTQTVHSPDGNSAITSDYIAQASQLPIMATTHYYFKASKMLKPFIGLGVGTTYMDQSLYYNVYVSSVNNWGFAIRPELGTLIIPNYHNFGFLLGVNYLYSTNKTDIVNLSSFQNFGINIGVVFTQ